MAVNRVILIVLDSVGIGEALDAAEFGDTGSHTLGHISHLLKGRIPNLRKLGLGNMVDDSGIEPESNIVGAYGIAHEASPGKDTTTGHWEISGLVMDQPFPYYPNGFPEELLAEFEAKIGTKTIGNKPASGTVIINELGKEHVKTGFPIVYTSADSVFQIAMHEDIIPVERQYEICKIARELLTGPHAVGRVIARPFVGEAGNFTRTANRKDFSLEPPGETILDLVKAAGKDVMAVGKIWDIFAYKGMTHHVKTADNQEGVDRTIEYIKGENEGLIFTNLVDFDMHFGHRRDPEGYANCVAEFDERLPEITGAMRPDDVLIITADHGNDPTFKGTDHTREVVPVIVYGASIPKGREFSPMTSFADIGATISDMLGIEPTRDGKSILPQLQRKPSSERVAGATAFIKEYAKGFQPELGLILGSGLGILADEIENPIVIPYKMIPDFPVSTVAGHAGQFVLGQLEGKNVLVMQGRFHYYEGYSIRDLAIPVWVMKQLGISKIMVTNAAGGVNEAFTPGDLMLITDHINFAFNNPLMGRNPADFGPRFPDTSQAYSPALQEIARKVATEKGIHLQEGVYQFMTGPTYETPAEVMMAKRLGADAVGMSTVPEVITAAHCGIEVLGISFISNMGAGISAHALSHSEVMETMDKIKDKFISFVRGIVTEI